mgnify:CR=1 FL=1
MVTVNAMGDKCPVPVIKTKKALDALTAPETIEVLVDNETAVANVTKMAQSTGATVTQEKLGEDEYKVTIKRLQERELRLHRRVQFAIVFQQGIR